MPFSCALTALSTSAAAVAGGFISTKIIGPIGERITKHGAKSKDQNRFSHFQDGLVKGLFKAALMTWIVAKFSKYDAESHDAEPLGILQEIYIKIVIVILGMIWGANLVVSGFVELLEYRGWSIPHGIGSYLSPFLKTFISTFTAGLSVSAFLEVDPIRIAGANSLVAIAAQFLMRRLSSLT